MSGKIERESEIEQKNETPLMKKVKVRIKRGSRKSPNWQREPASGRGCLRPDPQDHAQAHTPHPLNPRVSNDSHLDNERERERE